MAERPNNEPSYLAWLGQLLRELQHDSVPILLVAGLLFLAGAAAGFTSSSVTSMAQLLLNPLPLQEEREEEFSRMFAKPLDAMTASLLCMSDETLRMTMQRLNESGQLEQPFEELNELRGKVWHEVTVSKDTPYVTEYSPILKLYARSADAETAKLIVDTWSDVCVEMGETYTRKQQEPAADAFASRTAELHDELSQAEESLETFLRDNNLRYVTARVQQLIAEITRLEEEKNKYETDLAAEAARVETLQGMLAEEKPVRELQWRPSLVLLEQLGVPAKETGSEGETEPDSVLLQEVENPVYVTFREDLATAQADMAGFKARIAELAAVISEARAELEKQQAESARIEREEKRLKREAGIIEEAYRNTAIKQAYAEVAADMEQPVLNVLSYGAVWDRKRLFPALTYGVSLGIFGLALAAGVSLLLRVVVRPALAQAQ